MDTDLSKDALVLSQRLLSTKIKMLAKHPFFGLLAQHVKLAIDPTCPTACTDGETIYFGQEFSKNIGDEELYFVFMHEIMHIVLGHCFRGTNLDNERYNIAADIVINSILLSEQGMDDILIDGEYLMHHAPNGQEGNLYTAEEVYSMLEENDFKTAESIENSFFDDTSRWGTKDDPLNKAKWKEKIIETTNTLKNSNNGKGIPTMAKRIAEDLTTQTIDWRTVLYNFIQTEINDYSFSPPDRRFSDYDFLLPDFNEPTDIVDNVWIVIDASGSISSHELGLALNEVQGALDQFSGRFKGWMSFFDYDVSKPVPFDSSVNLKNINIYGGGGTSFINIFKARENYFNDQELTCIIIITDGYATWPQEEDAKGTPVLWLFNNSSVTPPWGIVARMKRK